MKYILIDGALSPKEREQFKHEWEKHHRLGTPFHWKGQLIPTNIGRTRPKKARIPASLMTHSSLITTTYRK